MNATETGNVILFVNFAGLRAAFVGNGFLGVSPALRNWYRQASSLIRNASELSGNDSQRAPLAPWELLGSPSLPRTSIRIFPREHSRNSPWKSA